MFERQRLPFMEDLPKGEILVIAKPEMFVSIMITSQTRYKEPLGVVCTPLPFQVKNSKNVYIQYLDDDFLKTGTKLV